MPGKDQNCFAWHTNPDKVAPMKLVDGTSGAQIAACLLALLFVPSKPGTEFQGRTHH
jgi:hypothetical protein